MTTHSFYIGASTASSSSVTGTQTSLNIGFPTSVSGDTLVAHIGVLFQDVGAMPDVTASGWTKVSNDGGATALCNLQTMYMASTANTGTATFNIGFGGNTGLIVAGIISVWRPTGSGTLTTSNYHGVNNTFDSSAPYQAAGGSTFTNTDHNKLSIWGVALAEKHTTNSGWGAGTLTNDGAPIQRSSVWLQALTPSDTYGLGVQVWEDSEDGDFTTPTWTDTLTLGQATGFKTGIWVPGYFQPAATGAIDSWSWFG